MSILVVFYLLSAMVLGIVWGGIIRWIGHRNQKRNDNMCRYRRQKIVRMGIIGWCAIGLVLGVLLLERLANYLYTKSEIEAIHTCYEEMITAIQHHEYELAYAMLSPAYRQRYSLQALKASPPSAFYRSRKSARDIEVRWDKTQATLTPYNIQIGPTFRFINIEGEWYLDGQTGWWF